MDDSSYKITEILGIKIYSCIISVQVEDPQERNPRRDSERW